MSFTLVEQVFPRGGFVNFAALNGLVDQLRALRINLAAAEGIVTHFAVAHIVVGGQTHRRAMRLDGGVRAGGLQLIQNGSGGLLNHVAQLSRGFAHAIHDYQNHGLFHVISS